MRPVVSFLVSRQRHRSGNMNMAYLNSDRPERRGCFVRSRRRALEAYSDSKGVYGHYATMEDGFSRQSKRLLHRPAPVVRLEACGKDADCDGMLGIR